MPGGLAKTSIEADVDSEHREKVSTTTSDSAYVTNGVHLITADNFTLAYPGIGEPATLRVYMTDQGTDDRADIHNRCGTVAPSPRARG